MAILAALSVFLLGVIVFGGCVFVVRRHVNISALQPNNETVSHYLGIVVGVYGIFSGFVIVSLWEQQRQAEDTIVQEASALRTIFRVSSALDDTVRQEIQSAALAYAIDVVCTEWPLITDEPAPQPCDLKSNLTLATLHYTHPAKDRIWDQIKDYKASGEHQNVFIQSLLDHYEDLSDRRRDRCYAAQRTLPPYLWLILILGSVLSVVCTLFIGTENIRTQASLTGISGGLLLLMLFVIHDLQHPFRGYWSAPKEAFEEARVRMMHSPPPDPPGKLHQAGTGDERHP